MHVHKGQHERRSSRHFVAAGTVDNRVSGTGGRGKLNVVGTRCETRRSS